MKQRRKNVQLSLLQSGAAALFILLAFGVTSLMDETLLVTSFGASAFIAFAFPKAESARPRYFIGGYACACVFGSLGAGARLFFAFEGSAQQILCCVLTIFCVILAMTLLDFEHPPSAALAITLVLSDRPLALSVVAMIGIVLLCACRVLIVRVAGALDLDEQLMKAIHKK